MKLIFSNAVVIPSLLTLIFAFASSMNTYACERSGVIASGDFNYQGNTPVVVPPEQTGAPGPAPGPAPVPGPGGGGGGGYIGPLWECMANNADCTVFWVIDVNPDLAQKAAMANCFNFPSQLCRPLGCHQLPAPY